MELTLKTNQSISTLKTKGRCQPNNFLGFGCTWRIMEKLDRIQVAEETQTLATAENTSGATVPKKLLFCRKWGAIGSSNGMVSEYEKLQKIFCYLAHRWFWWWLCELLINRKVCGRIQFLEVGAGTHLAIHWENPKKWQRTECVPLYQLS